MYIILGVIFGILLTCVAFLMVAVCIIWHFHQKTSAKKLNGCVRVEDKENSITAIDKCSVVYDVPVFNSIEESTPYQISMEHVQPEEMITHENIAYEQLYI